MISDKQNSIRRDQQYCRKRKRFQGKKIIDSLNKSIVKCRHQLTKFFSELKRMVTPSCSAGIVRKKGGKKTQLFEADDNNDDDNVVGPRPKDEIETNCIFKFTKLLPPLVSDKITRTIVLDLDETLVHSCLHPPPPRYDFTVSRDIEGDTVNFYVIKRPGVDEFLEMISQKYEIVVFTAGHEGYASKVLDVIDPKGYISHRFYRDSCKQVRGKFMKDLSELGRDLSKIVIVDDNPKSFELQPENGIPIKPFFGDELWDRELMKLAGFFERCDVFQDMRDAVNHYLKFANKESIKLPFL